LFFKVESILVYKFSALLKKNKTQFVENLYRYRINTKKMSGKKKKKKRELKKNEKN